MVGWVSFLVVVLVLCSFNTVLAAPTTIAGFEMGGLVGNEVTFNATTNDVNLETVVLSRGAGINPASLANAFSSTGFVVGGTKADAITNNEYLQVELQAKNIYLLNLNTLNFNLRRSATGPNTYQWQYSLDGFATAGVDVGAQGSYIGTETNGLAMPAIDLSGVAALQNLPSGSKVTLRLYAWGATNAGGTFAFGRLVGNDLEFVGIMSPNKLVAFDPDGENGDQATFGATDLDVNVNNSTLTRGAGIDPSVLTNSFSSNNYAVGANKAGSIANNEYIELKVEAKDYYRSNFDALVFNVRRSATGPNAYQWQYSLDDFATAGVDLGAQGSYTGTEANGLLMPTIDLSVIPSLQNVKSVTFRLYAWGATGSAGSFAIGRLADDDLFFTGNTVPNKIIAFDPNGENGDQITFDATTLDTNVNNSTLTRGAGIDPSFLLNGYSSRDYFVGGVKTDAISNNEYIEFKIQPRTGYSAALGQLSANLRRSLTGPNIYQWQYSPDDFNVRAIDVGAEFSYVTFEDDGTVRPQIDLSGIPMLQDIQSGNIITFRLYAWGAVDAPGTFAVGRLVGDDLSLSGEVSINSYNINYTAGVGGSISGDVAQTIIHGSDGTSVTAIPNSGYVFVDWSDGSTVNPRQDTNITSNTTYFANFAIDNTSILATGSGGPGAFYPPNGIGSGKYDVDIPIDAVKDVGLIDSVGINVLGRVRASALFKTLVSSTYTENQYLLKFIDVDLYRNIIKIRINANLSEYSLKEGDLLNIDLDNDGRSDVSVQFMDVYINRVELTIKSLLNNSNKDSFNDLQTGNFDANTSVLAVSKFKFTRDLQTGDIDEDVKELQKYLNNHGFILADSGPGSPGNETEKFGALTRGALIRFQKAKNISPAIGYFGPITRGVVLNE